MSKAGESKEQASCDVCVVGAGISGLVAAVALLEKGFSVHVLEANDRVGGRTLTQTVRGVSVDLGGTWVGPGQDDIVTLSKSLGVETALQHHKGKKVLDVDGRVSTYSSDIPSGVSVWGLLDLQYLLWKVDRMRVKVPLDNPHLCKHAKLWDATSADSFVRANTWTRGSRKLFEACVRGVFGVEPSELSLLYLLHYANASGGIERLVNIRNGHQERVFVGGAQQISIKLAAKIEAEFKKGKVVLNSPVTAIEQQGDRCLVTTPSGSVLRCREVIVAMPGCSTKRIEFTPRLPPARELLMNKQFLGCIVKVILLYERAFWRDRGYSGEVVCDTPHHSAPIFNVFDFCKTRADGSVQPGLVLFANGDCGRDWGLRPAEERRAAVLAQVKRWFGARKEDAEEALRPLEYLEKNWVDDEWTRGCPVSAFPTGALYLAGNALRAPCGRVHWAGTELAERMAGFMDGAVSSGRRAAAEVIENFAAETEGRPVRRTLPDRGPKRDDPPTSSWPLVLFLVVLLAIALSRGWLDPLLQRIGFEPFARSAGRLWPRR